MKNTRPNPVFCAIDTTDLDAAAALGASLDGAVGGLKLGKEFFTCFGPEGVDRVTGGARPLFLDLKFHDIPNTVAGGVRAAAKRLKPFMMTVHASGGPAMLRAAADASAEFDETRPLIMAVTVLTSMDADDLKAIGVTARVEDQVRRLAALAQANGVDGVVCSPREIDLVRAECGPDFKLVVPGIRPAGSDKGDQKRVMTPREAYERGADYLVIGRPITRAPDPAAAARAILAELEGA